MERGYNGYLVRKDSRAKLLEVFPPVHPDVIAHHITHKFNVHDHWPPDAYVANVVGYAEDEKVQAVVVEINGSFDRANQGAKGIYHITISVNRENGGKPVDSNKLIEKDVTWLENSIQLKIHPCFWPFES